MKLRAATKPAIKKVAAAVSAALSEGVLLQYQKDWVSDDSPVKVWEKSRRIGASWTDACDSALKSGAAKGKDCLYIGYSEDFTREYIDACAFWLKHFNYAASEVCEFIFQDTDESGETKDIKAFRIDCASGFKVLGLSSRPRSIRGKQGKVTIDEAAFHDDLPGLMKAALAMLVWGGQVCVISSHFGEDNPFNLLVKDIKAGKKPYSLHKTTFMDAIDHGLYSRVCFRQGIEWTAANQDKYVEDTYAFYGEDADEELDCIPSMGSGVYIPRTVIERCQKPDIKTVLFKQKPEFVLQADRLEVTRKWYIDNVRPHILALPPGVRTVAGQDFGRSGDLSAITPLYSLGAGRWREIVNIEMRGIPFDCQELIVKLLVDDLPLLHHFKFDARGNGQSHAEKAMQYLGATKVECVMLTAQWYAEFFPKYKAGLEDQSMELACGEDVIADHRRVVMSKGRPKMDEGKDKGSDGGQRHGDKAVANVLAWAATLVEGQPPAGATVDAANEDLPSSRFAGRQRGRMFNKRAA